MISWILFVIITLGCAVWAISLRNSMYVEVPKYDRWGEPVVDDEGNPVMVKKSSIKPALPVIAAFVLGIILSIIQPYTYTRVDAGHVGVKVNLTGHDRGISDVKYTTGWVLYNTWMEELYEFPTYQQHIEYEDQRVILKGGFSTVIRPTFNYSLKKEKVTEMFSELRLTLKEIEQGWLKTAIISSVNDVANRWEVDQIFNEREQFEMEIIAECNERVGMWFNVSLLRTNIVPPASIQAAIEAQVKAVKETQAKNQQVLVTKANGEIMIAQAKADSAEAVIKAQGKAESMLILAEAEAEAIKIKQREVNPIYNDYVRAKKWNGAYPTTVAGGGTNFLMNLK